MQDLARQQDSFQQDIQILWLLQVGSKDARRIVGPAGSQRDVSATRRAQCAGVYRHPVSGKSIAAVVVELRRYEMQLDVGALIGCKPAAHEAAGFRNVADSGT